MWYYLPLHVCVLRRRIASTWTGRTSNGYPDIHQTAARPTLRIHVHISATSPIVASGLRTYPKTISRSALAAVPTPTTGAPRG